MTIQNLVSCARYSVPQQGQQTMSPVCQTAAAVHPMHQTATAGSIDASQRQGKQELGMTAPVGSLQTNAFDSAGSFEIVTEENANV